MRGDLGVPASFLIVEWTLGIVECFVDRERILFVAGVGGGGGWGWADIAGEGGGD